MMLQVDEALRQIQDSQAESNQFRHILNQIRQEFERDLTAESKIFFEEFLKRKQSLLNERDELIKYKMNQADTARIHKVLKQIQKKQVQNSEFLATFKKSFEQTRQKDGQQIMQRCVILQAQVDRLKEIFSMPGLFKSNKERQEALNQAQKNTAFFKKKLQELRKVSEQVDSVRITGNVQSVCMELLRQPTAKEVLLTVQYVQKTGKEEWEFRRMSLEQHERILDCILVNKKLRQLDLRFMDYEFDEVKCQTLKRQLSRPGLAKLRVHNYYTECKMGIFVDFNWKPFRKDIHVFSGKW